MARRGAAARGTWRPRKRKPSHTPADVGSAGDFDGDAAEGGRAPPKKHRAGAAGGGFFCCYLLRSLCPRSKGRTYIGFTVNPRRRIRQHNGEISSGAWKTRRGRPWEMVLCIYGFPSNVAALQFEWAWQHPTESHAVREAAAEFKSRWSVGKMVKLAYTMLNLPSWEHLNLTVNFFSSKNTKFAAGCPPLPTHMKTVVCAMEDLQYQADRPSSEEDGNDIREEEPADNEDEEPSDWPILDGYSYPDHCFQQPSSADDQVQPMDEQTRTDGFDVEDDLAHEFFAPTVEWSKILDTRELNGLRTSPLCSLSPCSDDDGLEGGTGLVSPLLMPNASANDGGDGRHILDGNHVVDLVTPTPVGRLRIRDCVSSICAMEDLQCHCQAADGPSSEEDGNDIREEPQDNEDDEMSDSPIQDGYSYSDHCFQQPSTDDDQVQPMDEQTRTAGSDGSDVDDDLADDFFAPPMDWSEILETRRELKGPRTSPLCSLSPCIDDAGLDKGTGLMSPLLMPNASADGGDGRHILDGNHVVDLVTPTPVGRLRKRDCVSSICPKIIDLTSSPVVIQL